MGVSVYRRTVTRLPFDLQGELWHAEPPLAGPSGPGGPGGI